jgi:hypothetical protein
MNDRYLQAVCYLDTNLLIYMFDARDKAKQLIFNVRWNLVVAISCQKICRMD